MDTVHEWMAKTCGWAPSSCFLTGAAVVSGVAVTYVIYQHGLPFFRPNHKTYPPEVVTLHKFGPNKSTPGISPFVTKLETYMRLAKIPYKTVCGMALSSKGKVPWLSHQNSEIPDSQFCIEYLNKTFNVNLNKNMSERDRAVARAMRILVEDSLYWYLVIDRWVYQTDKRWITDLGFNRFMPWYAKRPASNMAYAHGMGRHLKHEVYRIALSDVKALSIQLGDKPFFFGDHPVEEDCAIFGQLSSIYYGMYGGVVSTYIKDDLTNLAAFCDRMKALAWPDWNDCLLKT